MPLPTGVPAAATTALQALLSDPARPAVVLGVFPPAVYLGTGDDVVAVVSTDALRLPCALVLAAHSTSRPFDGIRSGQSAAVGDGAVAVGDRRFVVRRWWQPRRAPTLDAGPGLITRTDALAALLPDLPEPLPADRTTWPPSSLVGLGPGLTPAGDDVLAAMLLTLSAAPGTAAELDALASETLALLTRTTSFSATLLRHAAAGRGIPEVIDVLDALAGSGDLDAATVRLLAVGHSSGAALAHGILAGGRLVAAAARPQPDATVTC